MSGSQLRMCWSGSLRISHKNMIQWKRVLFNGKGVHKRILFVIQWERILLACVKEHGEEGRQAGRVSAQ